MSTANTFVSITLAVFASTAVACSSAENSEDADEGAGAQYLSEGTLSGEDLAEADRLSNTSMFVANPRLGRSAVAKVIYEDSWDGSWTKTYVVKDSDGRLFQLSTSGSDSSESTLDDTHGAPPNFSDGRYFLLLNEEGIDWALARHRRVASTRHARILASQAADPDSVKTLRTTPAGDTIVWFNSSVFVVAPGGLDDACKTANVPACAQKWQRLNNGQDPFDVK